MKKRVGIIILVLLLLILAGGGAAFYYYYSKYINIDAIYPGMTIQGMSGGGMTQEEAKAKVQEYVDKVSQETVTLQVKKKESTFALSDIGLKCTNMDVVEKAYDFGKTGNVFKRVIEVRKLEKEGMDFPLTFSVDKAETRKVVKKKAKKFLAKKKDATITRKDGKFVITKQVDGVDIEFHPKKKKLTASLQVRPFEFIRRTDSSQLLNFIQDEHPQTIALILSYLPPSQASAVISSLPPEKQADVARRIAQMDRTSPDVIKQVEKVLEKKLASLVMQDYTIVGCVDAIVEILNSVDRGTERHIMETLEVEEPELADEIRKKMFVFEDILSLDDRAILRVL